MNVKKMQMMLGMSAVVALVGLIGVAVADDAETPKLPLCPVMGEAVDFNVSTTTPDGPVYFCCAGCIKKLAKDPDKYAEKTAEQRKALANLTKVQVSCPISGKPIDAKTAIDHKGGKVSFCCERCPSTFQADPEKFAEKLAASYTYQTTCPVSGEPIDPASFKDLGAGKHIYFCSGDCESKFMNDVKKFAPKLEAQGYPVNVAKLVSGALKGAGG